MLRNLRDVVCVLPAPLLKAAVVLRCLPCASQAHLHPWLSLDPLCLLWRVHIHHFLHLLSLFLLLSQAIEVIPPAWLPHSPYLLASALSRQSLLLSHPLHPLSIETSFLQAIPFPCSLTLCLGWSKDFRPRPVHHSHWTPSLSIFLAGWSGANQEAPSSCSAKRVGISECCELEWDSPCHLSSLVSTHQAPSPLQSSDLLRPVLPDSGLPGDSPKVIRHRDLLNRRSAEPWDTIFSYEAQVGRFRLGWWQSNRHPWWNALHDN